MVIPSHGGAGHQLIAKYMIFTSNYHPKYWWKRRSPSQLRQTLRRIDWLFPFMFPRVKKVAPTFLLNGYVTSISDQFVYF